MPCVLAVLRDSRGHADGDQNGASEAYDQERSHLRRRVRQREAGSKRDEESAGRMRFSSAPRMDEERELFTRQHWRRFSEGKGEIGL